MRFQNEALLCKGTFDSLVVQNMYRESHTLICNKCHNSKFGIFELLV